MRLAQWLLLFSSSVLVPGQRVEIADGLIDEDYDYTEQLLPTHERVESSTHRCCTDSDPANLLVVSTMDGKVQALDVADGGNIVWQSDLDGAALLGGNLGKMEPLQSEDDRFILVPSLDGSLYMFSLEQQLLEPIPQSTDMLLQSVRIGREAVAGGKSITTTGVDPATGKIRYHCTSAQCEQSTGAENAHSTLVFRRKSHNIRAVDALNGSEKWNLSVSEYDATLVRRSTVTEPERTNRPVRFLISPPKGSITALNQHGEAMWTQSLGVHIARSWHLDGYDLNEVSLFDSNIHSIETTAVMRPESLFYLGTIDNEPFILCSEKVRDEMSRLARQIDYIDHGKRKTPTTALAKPYTYQISEGILDEMLGSALKHSMSKLSERARKERGTHALEERPPSEMTIALPATEEGTNEDELHQASCHQNDGMLLIGQDNIRNAEPNGERGGDQGWFVLRPDRGARNVRSALGLSLKPSTCTAQFVKRSLRLENDVNPLWRLLAIVLLFITGITGYFRFAKIRRRWKAVKEAFEAPLPSPLDGGETVDPLNPILTQPSLLSISAPNPETEDVIPAPIRHTLTDEVPKKLIVPEHAASSTPLRKRNTSTRSGSNINLDEYTSKFLADFDPVRVLGHGGFGVVFEARNKLDECHYAVKRIAVSNSEKAIERVLREVRAMAKLDHVGIIRYYHTWIERPPEGWQKEKDQEMLKAIRASRTLVKKISKEISSSSTSSDSARDDESSLVSQDIAEPITRGDTTEEQSWLDDTKDQNGNGRKCDSSTDESSSDDSMAVDQIVAMKTTDGSESIVFGLESEKQQTRSQHSSEVSKLDTDMVLVTSVDDQLLPSKNTSNYVYLYIQMQLCLDKTLYKWLLENKTMESREPEKMKAWMRQMVSAVAYIHQQGLIHRDIKPQNIFFGSANAIKIGDLGLVTKGGEEQLDEETSKDRSASCASLHTDNVGTRTYMSPEQLANQPYTSKVDVFSLGLIFTELNVPFETLMERSKVLSGLQKGIQPDHVQDRKELAQFIAWLTSMKAEDRPTCDQILASPFLS